MLTQITKDVLFMEILKISDLTVFFESRHCVKSLIICIFAKECARKYLFQKTQNMYMLGLFLIFVTTIVINGHKCFVRHRYTKTLGMS